MRLRRLGLLSALLAPLGLALVVRCGGLPDGFLDPDRHASTRVVDREGRPLYEALSPEGSRGRRIAPERLPETLVLATLAAEDARFYRHPGIDPLALARAAWHDLRARRLAEGGSTLTQQTIKILSARPRTLRGKLWEMLLALRLEHALSKREILALYLSVAPYGNQIEGAEAASQAYFGTPAGNLTPAQAAFLAGLPQRPSAFNPYRDPRAAEKRKEWILKRMEALSLLPRGEAEHALAERLALVRDPRAFVAPHFVERVLGDLPAGARRVQTTLDRALQEKVHGIVAARREVLLAHGAHNVAVAVLDNRTGEWLAWEGSGDWADVDHGGSLDGVVCPRQPGSALKPFTYALAFEGACTPATVIPDVPSHFPTAEDGVLYSPRNYDGVFRGPLRARPALAGSENVPAVWTLSQVGVPALLRLLRKAGLTTLDKTPDYYGYGLTMGDAEVRLDELVAAYAALARGGVTLAPRLVKGVWGPSGERLAEPAPRAPERIVSERAAFWITDVLSDPRARAYIFGRGGSLEFPFPVAAKTGTSQSYHDNWTVGFTRDVTVGVWVGNFDRSELRNSSGVTGAAPLFHDVLLAAEARVHGGLPGEAEALALPPSDLVRRPICALSGGAATRACPRIELEWLPRGEASVPCSWHRAAPGRSRVVWPTPYRAWAREAGLLEPDEARPARARGPVAELLRIRNPPPDSVYLKDPTLREAFQTLPLRAEAPPGTGPLLWEVDGRAVGRAPSEDGVEWPLALGRHVVTVRSSSGHADTTIVLVK